MLDGLNPNRAGLIQGADSMVTISIIVVIAVGPAIRAFLQLTSVGAKEEAFDEVLCAG